MADENEEKKNIGSTEVEDTLSNFNKAMDDIDKENVTPPEEGDEHKEGEVEQTDDSAGSDEGQEESVDAETSEVLQKIDAEVLECCRDYGWDDKKIAQVYSVSPELFDDIKEQLNEDGGQVIAKDSKEPAKENKQEQTQSAIQKTVDELKFNLDPELHGKEVVDAISKLAERVNQDSKNFSEEKARLQSEIDTAYNSRIDGHLDKLFKTFPDLGKSEKLTRRQYELRSEIYAHAYITASMRKVPIERALEIETNRFKNQGGEKVIGQKILDKLNKQKKTFTNTPTRKQGEVERKFADESERQEYAMEQAERKAGLVQ